MITPMAITNTKNHVRDQITRVRINGTTVLNDFSIEEGSDYFEVVIEIPEGITSVTKLELMSDTTPWVSSIFYVDVLPNTFFKHKITIKGE